MSDSKPDIDIKPRVNPLVANMPAHLKDHANYKKIRKVIIESLAGKCSHGEIVEWAACKKCQVRFRERSFVLQRLGFASPAEYMVWQKIHEEIDERFPLVDWSKENAKRKLNKLDANK